MLESNILRLSKLSLWGNYSDGFLTHKIHLFQNYITANDRDSQSNTLASSQQISSCIRETASRNVSGYGIGNIILEWIQESYQECGSKTR